jgi:GDP-4-dehydro-6-deoxy-D-mannose reductase
VLERGAAGSVYNVCSGRVWRISELLRILLQHAAVEIRVEVEPSRHRAIDIPVLHGNPGRLVREAGWAPQRTMESTLLDLLEYWRGRTAIEAGAERSPVGAGPASPGRTS